MENKNFLERLIRIVKNKAIENNNKLPEEERIPEDSGKFFYGIQKEELIDVLYKAFEELAEEEYNGTGLREDNPMAQIPLLEVCKDELGNEFLVYYGWGKPDGTTPSVIVMNKNCRYGELPYGRKITEEMLIEKILKIIREKRLQIASDRDLKAHESLVSGKEEEYIINQKKIKILI